jgi:predicted GH43/DUF377 family glycosyl hydrolase
MKSMVNRVLLAGLMLVMAGSLALAQDDEAAITWTLVSEEPVSPRGETGEWNSTYNEPGAAIYYEGQYHLFVNGYPGFPADNGIGYRISDDGVTYEWAVEGPVLRSEDAPNDPIAIAASDVLVLEDGTWVLYYFNFNSSAWPRIQATIGRATADDPAGPWTFDDDPVLVQGEEDSWDEASVSYASVLPTEDGYVMYFIGQDGRSRESLGRAVSEDGIAWEKDPDPVFELDPGLNEGISFVVNQVVYDGERWILAYKFSRSAIGIATSDDGITFERYPDNPILTALDLDGINQIGYMSFLVDDDGGYMLYFEGNSGGRTQVYAATVTIP